MPDGGSGQARDVAVFRHNLFRTSETFITQQARQLRRYHPIYLGRLRQGEAPAGAASHVLSDLGGLWAWPRICLQMLTRDPSSYLRLLAGWRPALIHAHFGVDGVYALPVAKRLGIPLVTTFHGFDATLSTIALLSSPAWANYPLFRGQLGRQGDLFLCASSFIRDRLLAIGFPEARTRLHYIGVDCAAIGPRDPAEETRTILHVARLVEVKGTRHLIGAFARVAQRFADVDLAIIGDGPLKAPLQSQARALGIGARVRFMGALPYAEVLDQMRKAAMLVLPSVRTSTGRVEGLGMVLLEAAATGVPAIASRIGGIPEGVIDNETGFLVPERDEAALAERIGALLEHRDMRLAMGAKGRALVEERFDLRRQTDLLEEHYDSLLVR
ncbi:MAG TPA: glycosyltransferase [Alphaproteobacteria bacterium]|nr:glycosyltransferase [Alphaproteobacteria bacterium]